MELATSDLTERSNRRRESKYLGARVEHAAHIGADAILDVVERAVVPLRVPGVSPKSLARRVSPREESAKEDEEDDDW